MHRRMVLTSLFAPLSGCIGTGDGEGTTTRPAPTTAETTTERTIDTTTEPPATTVHPYESLVVDPASMSVDEVQAHLADHDCDELIDLSMTCPEDDSRLDVSMSPSVAELSGDAVELTVTNRADEPFQWNAYDWTLRKWDGDGWRRIAPLAVPAPLHGLAPGKSHTYRIVATESDPIDGRRAYVAEEDVTIGGLGPGVYGFSTDGYFESTPDDEFATGALFGFAGEGPPVRLTDAVGPVERDGSELVVDASSSADRKEDCTISLVEGEPEARLLAEHVHQLAPLVNALPYLATDGVETVRYVGSASEVGVVDSYLSAVTSDGASRYGFQELVFEVSGTE